MRLDGWLRKDPSVVDRLRFVERLAQAVNAAHEHGQLLAGLDPSRIEVSSDGECELADALRGTAAAEYRAPEREGGAPATAESDVYAGGAIAWEALAGRAYAAAPSHLSEARPDLPGELADAVMACLERSPEWRPRDMAYVAQLAQLAASSRGGSARAAAPKAAAAPRPERAKKSHARPAAEARGERGESRPPGPLLIAALLLVAAAGGGYYWWTSAGSRTAVPPAPLGAARPVPGATPSAPTATAEPAATPDATLHVTPTAPAAATPMPLTAVPTPTPTPVPVAPTVAAIPPSRPTATEPAAAAPPSTAASTPASSTSAPVATAPAPVAPPAATREAAVLSTLSPLSVKRPGKVLFDLHGAGLASDLQARLVAVRDATRGLSVVRQKCSGTLCSVLVELDESVKPAAYAIVLEDPAGRQTNALTFTVTR